MMNLLGAVLGILNIKVLVKNKDDVDLAWKLLILLRATMTLLQQTYAPLFGDQVYYGRAFLLPYTIEVSSVVLG
jgi:hypothetical protein